MTTPSTSSVREVLESMGRLPKGATRTFDYVHLLASLLARIRACTPTTDLDELERTRRSARRAIRTATPVAEANPAIEAGVLALSAALGPLDSLVARLQAEAPDAASVDWGEHAGEPRDDAGESVGRPSHDSTGPARETSRSEFRIATGYTVVEVPPEALTRGGRQNEDEGEETPEGLGSYFATDAIREGSVGLEEEEGRDTDDAGPHATSTADSSRYQDIDRLVPESDDAVETGHRGIEVPPEALTRGGRQNEDEGEETPEGLGSYFATDAIREGSVGLEEEEGRDTDDAGAPATSTADSSRYQDIVRLVPESDDAAETGDEADTATDASDESDEEADDPVEEYERIAGEVNDAFAGPEQSLPELAAQYWKERIVSAGNLVRRKQPDYPAAIAAMNSIKEDLEKNADAIAKAAYESTCARFLKTLQQTVQLVPESSAVAVRAFVKIKDDVAAGTLDPAKGMAGVREQERELQQARETRVQRILGIVADYERLMPILDRAEAVQPSADDEQESSPGPGPAQNVVRARRGFGALVGRMPIVGQFFSRRTGLAAPPPQPEAPPNLGDVRKIVEDGFAGAFRKTDLAEIERHVAELENLARQTLLTMDVEAELRRQEQSLPCNPAKMRLARKKPLGHGNFADTYVVLGPTLRVPEDPAKPDGPKKKVPQRFAGKVLKDSAADHEAVLDAEAEIYARLGEHPNIARCYGKQQLRGTTTLVMELVDGKSAQDTFADLRKRYNGNELTRAEFMGGMQHIIHGILMGLAQFEALGLAHLDIKADNIRMDTKTGAPKILDMGLVHEHGTLPPGVKTPFEWHPPELIAMRDIGPVSDSYSLGQTIFQQLESELVGWNGEEDIEVERKLVGPDGEEEITSFEKKITNAWKLADPKPGVRGGPMFVAGSSVARDGTRLVPEQFLTGAVKAVREGDAPHSMPLSRKSADKPDGEQAGALAPAAKPGAYGVESAYVAFMNSLMHPDPAQRMTPSEALRHPFMTDRLMTKQELELKVFPKPAPASSRHPRNDDPLGIYGATDQLK